MAPLLRFETAERGFARNVVERHSPQAGFDPHRLVESGAVHSVSSPVLLQRRDNTNGSSDTPVVSMPSVTDSTKALVGITVFLGVVVLAVAGLRLRKFLRSRRPKGSRSPYLKPLSLCHSPMPEKIISEKRNPTYTQTLLDFGYDGLQPPSKTWCPDSKPRLLYSNSEDHSVGWRPQTLSEPEDSKDGLSPDLIPRPFLPPPPPAHAATRLSHFPRLASVFARSPKPSVVSFEVDITPPYTSAAPTPKSNSPIFPPDSSVSASNTSAEVKPSPSPKRKHQKTLTPIRVDASNVQVPRVPVPAFDPAAIPDITVTEAPQIVTVPDVIVQGSALKSPIRLDSAKSDAKCFELQGPKSSARRSRKSLFSLKHSSSSTSSSGSDLEAGDKFDAPGKKLPRLVIVVDTFNANLQDELRIRVGEVLRMTHEFRDGWCAVERLGKEDEQGVVPRFCVADRASIIPDGPRVQSLINNAPLIFTGSSALVPATQGTN
ncbi:FUS1 [Sanghuangporus weigelae]